MYKQVNLSFSVIAQAQGNDLATTQFSTQDKNSAKLIFTVRQGKTPFDLTGKRAIVTLVMYDKSEFDEEADITDPLNGIIEYTISPQQIRHPGKVKGDLRIIAEDGSSVGGFDFTFTIKSALIDRDLKLVKEFYIEDFETVKEEVLNLANEALVDIDSFKTEIYARTEAVEDKVNSLEADVGEAIVFEVEEARGDYVDLDTRIKEDVRRLDAELSTKADFRDIQLLSFPKYGKITLPEDFRHNLDFTMWRDLDGKIKHNFDFDKRTADYKTIYIGESGTDTNDGLTKDKPKGTMSKIIDEAEADPTITGVKIVIVGNYLGKDRMYVDKKILTKNYAIVPERNDIPCYYGNFQVKLAWTLVSDGVYSATRTGALAVFDAKFSLEFGFPSTLVKVDTLDACKATKGSWYTDGTLVYVHRQDDSPIVNEEVFVGVSTNIMRPIFDAVDSTFMIRDITIINGGGAAPITFQGQGTTAKGHVILKNVKLTGSYGDSPNGIATAGVKSIWCFDCIVKDTARDGFNYHNIIDGDTFALEYNCIAYNCGLNNTEGNNNATTGHEGARILRVGTKGWNTTGPVLADVNGCYSICIDCTMHDSTRGAGDTKSAYWFSDDVSSVNPTPNGKAILINCEGGGKDTFSINCGDTFKNNKITIDNFRGRNIPSNIKFNVLG